jgi:diadenosine tetraphosphate (Ap4A) HIT family hydrolase
LNVLPSTEFALHPNLRSKLFIKDLPLCRVLLENERHYPWLLLVPRRSEIARIMDLTSEDQLQLLAEMDLGQKFLWNQFKPTQINVAAIGNKTPQLHIHLIARFQTDPAWPGTVWDHPVRTAYSAEDAQEMLEKMRGI